MSKLARKEAFRALIRDLFAVDKYERFKRIIKQHGGWKRALAKGHINDVLKEGEMVGEDKYGNKYYENHFYFYPKSRWVEYNEKAYLDYDGSQLPAEWHRWMHHSCEHPPTVEKPVQYEWMIDHQENLTGSRFAYMPYSTVKPKIKPWVPNTSNNLKLEAGSSNQP